LGRAGQRSAVCFADKSPILRRADDISVSIAIQLHGSRAKAFEALVKRGWEALEAEDFQAVNRAVQSCRCLRPRKSQISHGFAIIAYTYQNDAQFADELFRIALKQPGRHAN
jgi:hypothetical protein